jgi:enoyl-CoA hydratase/carnithine racemase
VKEKLTIEFENNSFKGWRDESVAIVKIKCNAFYSLVDIETSRQVLNWFDLVSEQEDINVILFLNEKGCLGNTAYEVFVTELTGKEFSKEPGDLLSENDLMQVRSKEINILNSFIRAIVNYRKLTVFGLNGTIVTPFFGTSLASNFRFASEDLVISLAHVKYGIHASGALPFFLPKYIGIGKATEYVFEGGKISAKEAVQMGLINKIILSQNFDEDCIKYSKILASNGGTYIRWTKHLLIRDREELINYLHEEEKYVDQYKELTT